MLSPGTKGINISVFFCFFSASEEELDSDESSGKDWSDLEEEARKGLCHT